MSYAHSEGRKTHQKIKNINIADPVLWPLFTNNNTGIGHREPIVLGLLIGAKMCRETRGSYFL